ncbi:MAG: hypothetical protein LBR16_00265 [Treponema sp.]|nr:hypothetical protein [Treponema sp.]
MRSFGLPAPSALRQAALSWPRSRRVSRLLSRGRRGGHFLENLQCQGSK